MKLPRIFALIALLVPILVSTACGRQGNRLQNPPLVVDTQAAPATAVSDTATQASAPTDVPAAVPTDTVVAPTEIPPTVNANITSNDVQDLLNLINSLDQANQSDDALDNLP